MPAEAVPGDAGAEAVLDEVAGAGEEPEVAGRDDQVQVARARAHGAVALQQIEVPGGARLDPDTAAMAGSGMPARLARAQVRGAFHGGARSDAR